MMDERQRDLWERAVLASLPALAGKFIDPVQGAVRAAQVADAIVGCSQERFPLPPKEGPYR